MLIHNGRGFDISALMHSHRPWIYHLLRSFSFISKNEFDDYYQEVFIYAWRYRHKFDGKFPFAIWIKPRLRTAVILFRCRLLGISKDTKFALKRYSDRYVYPEDMQSFDQAQLPKYDGIIQELHDAIKSLTSVERLTVEMFLDDKEFDEESLRDGFDRNYYYRIFTRAKKKIRAMKDSHFTDVIDYHKSVGKPWLVKDGSEWSRAVNQYDLTGTLIKCWLGGISEIQRESVFNPAAIQNCTKGRYYQHAGYRWIFDGEKDEKILNLTPNSRKNKPILQFTTNMEFVRRWSGIHEAVQAGFDRPAIAAVCKGRKQTYRKFIWRYETSSKDN